MKLDSNNDEIIWEVKYVFTWWDYILSSIFFPVGCLGVFVCLAALSLIRLTLGDTFIVVIFLTMFVGATIMLLHDLLYKRKNRFYVTNEGIGFERKYKSKIEKGFFKFGEVGIVREHRSKGIFNAQPIVFFIFPLQTQVLSKWYGYVIKNKAKIRIVVLTTGASIISPKIYNKISGQIFLEEFIIQKSKEAVESQNITIKSFSHFGRFAIFGVKNELQK